MAMYDPTTSSHQGADVDRNHHQHRPHHLPSSIPGQAQAPLMMDSRMGADEVFIRPISWSTGPAYSSTSRTHRESEVTYRETFGSGSTVRLIEDEVRYGDDGQVMRKISGLFGFGSKKGSGGGKERGSAKEPGFQDGKKRKPSRRLSEMLGLGGAGDTGGSSEKSGWRRRLSLFTWHKAKSPTRKDSAWPKTLEDDGQDLEAGHIVPQNTAAKGSNYPYLSQADQYAPGRRSHDAETVSDHWTPFHSATHSEANLLHATGAPGSSNEQDNDRGSRESLPQLYRCRTQTQWQELQRASRELYPAHRAVTPPQTVSPAAELAQIHQRASRSLERVQRAYEEGKFDHAKIAKTFDDDLEHSPEAQIKARDDYLRIVAARRAELDAAFAQVARRQQRTMNTDCEICCHPSTRQKSSVPDRSTRNTHGEGLSKSSVGSEVAQLAGVIGISMQQAYPLM